MTETRIARALDRIDRQLQRLEEVERRYRQPPDGGWAAQKRLELRVRGAINDLDDLIAGLER